MRLFLTLIYLAFNAVFVQAQTDTLIDESTYEIISRHPNGQAKYLGQFEEDCSGNKHTRHGKFLTYNRRGVLKKKEFYFYNGRHNRKILGLKHGWWGFFGRQSKYFFGIKRYTVIVDPCF